MEGVIESRPSVRFEVERVIGISEDGTYQVQWAPAWVSKFHLVGCEHLIQEFLQRQVEKAHPEEKLSTTNHLANHDNGSPLSSCTSSDGEKILYYNDSVEKSLNLNHSDLGLIDITESKSCDKNVDNHDIIVNEDEKNTLLCTTIAVKVKEDEQRAEIGASPPLVYILNSNETNLPWHPKQYPLKRAQEDQATAAANSSQAVTSEESSVESSLVDSTSEPCVSGTRSSGKKYQCHVCSKSFKQSSHLKSHLKIHSGERPYTCSLCSATFAHKHSLNRHYRTHTRTRPPYGCTSCNQLFVEKEKFDRHVCDMT